MIRRRFASTPAGQLHFREAGSGPPLVLMHETARSGDGFRFVTPALADRFRVLALDTPGFGESYRPIEPPGLAGYAQSIVDFLNALEIERAHLLGFHTGASFAAEAAARFPERIDRLLLCGLPDFTPERREQSRSHQQPLALKPDGSHLTALWAGVPAVRQYWGTLETVNQYVLDAAGAMPNSHWAHVAVLEQDIRDVLPRIAAPTLVFCSAADGFVRFQPELVQLLPNGRGDVITESEKFPMYNAVDRFGEVVTRFLAEPLTP